MRVRVFVILALGLAALSGAVRAQRSDPSAQALLRAATDKEVVDGDLKGAIAQYQAIVDRFGSTDRATAAQALLRAADAYRKLGDPQAIRAYQRIVDQYPDQPTALKAARSRLSTTSVQSSVPGVRSLWSGPDADLRGRISHDGRYVSGGAAARPSNLVIRDLVTGQTTTLTNSANDVEYVEHSIFSPDDSKLAYAWYNSRKRYELRVIDRTGGQPRVLYELPSEAAWMQAFDWSPDGRAIAVQINSEGFEKLALVSAVDGSLKILKSFPAPRSPYNISFSPDGRFIAYDVPPGETGSARDIFVLAVDGSREAPASSHSANDEVLDWFPDGKRLLVTSDRTGTNDVYSIGIDDGRPVGEPQLLKRDVGGVRAAMGFLKSGEFAIGTRPESGDVQIATLDPAGGVADALRPLAGHFTGNRFNGVWSRDGQQLAYLSRVPHQQNQNLLSIYTARTAVVRTVPVSLSWFYPDVAWDVDNRHVLLAGTFNGRGGLHHIDIDSGRVDASRNGPEGGVSRHMGYPLAMLPEGGALLLAGSSRDRRLMLVRRELATSRETVVVDAPFVAFALSSNGRQVAVVLRYGPDGQPIGRANVPNATDVVQVVPLSGGQPREIFKGARLGTALAWAPDGQAVYFSQMPTGAVWRVPAEGGTANELPIKVAGLTHISVNPDGRQLAVSTSTRLQEVLAIGPFATP